MTHCGIGVANASGRKIPLDEPIHPLPSNMAPLTAAAQTLPPQSPDALAEGPQGNAVAGHPVIPQVSRDHAPHIGSLLRYGCVHALPHLGVHLVQLRLHPRAHRLPQHRKVSLLGGRTAMGKPQEVKGLGLPLPAPLAVACGPAAELNQTRLGRDEAPSQTLPCALAGSTRNCSAWCRCSNPTMKSSA